MASGGYRAPVNPSPASGPGRLSKRTDGGPGQKMMVANGLAYGERQQTLAQERTAPMAQADTPPALNIPSAPTPSQAGNMSPAQARPFDAPTNRPTEPITQGVNIGPGANQMALPMQAQPQYQQQGPMTQMLQGLAANDMTGSLAQLYLSARAQGA